MTNIKVFLDFSCPFCYIGFEIMNRLKREDLNVDLSYIPLELNPDMSHDGDSLLESIPLAQIENSYKRIEALAKEYNLVFHNKSRVFNTHRLHLAALYSKREDKFYHFAKQAFKAIFTEGKNVAEKEIVNEIGLAAGLNIVEMNNCIEADDLKDDLRNSVELKSIHEIDSVPTFIVNDKKKVTLLKEYSEFKKDLLE